MLSKRTLTLACALFFSASTLSGCSFVDAYKNAMPTGYKHNSNTPISEPQLTHPYDKDIAYTHQDVQEKFNMHKDKVDQLLAQIQPSLRLVNAGEKLFLVSEQKNRDFDDALRLGLRNMGLELDLTSMARYQLIYTIRKTKKTDFEGMSVQPEKNKMTSFDLYTLDLIDTTNGQNVAEAYLIPGYYGFKVPAGYTPEKDMKVEEVAAEQGIETMPAKAPITAQPVMDDSPMMVAPEENNHSSTPVTTGNVSYQSVYSNETATNAPMPITEKNDAIDITAH